MQNIFRNNDTVCFTETWASGQSPFVLNIVFHFTYSKFVHRSDKLKVARRNSVEIRQDFLINSDIKSNNVLKQTKMN